MLSLPLRGQDFEASCDTPNEKFVVSPLASRRKSNYHSGLLKARLLQPVPVRQEVPRTVSGRRSHSLGIVSPTLTGTPDSVAGSFLAKAIKWEDPARGINHEKKSLIIIVAEKPFSAAIQSSQPAKCLLASPQLPSNNCQTICSPANRIGNKYRLHKCQKRVVNAEQK